LSHGADVGISNVGGFGFIGSRLGLKDFAATQAIVGSPGKKQKCTIRSHDGDIALVVGKDL
jgi:hypothetical protein